jgi:quinol-cytochrome oxidoreductase complex cytochrome b subunit
MSEVRRNVLQFAAVVVAVDVVGLGAWSLLPPATGIRTGVLFGTLVVAPLLGFLLVYAPAASRAGE